MKSRRRKDPKYEVDDNGQITDLKPVVSPRTQMLLELAAFAEAFEDGSLLDDEETTDDVTTENVEEE